MPDLTGGESQERPSEQLARAPEYKRWPGLVNPLEEEPTKYTRGVIDQMASNPTLWWEVRRGVYLLKSLAVRFGRFVSDEVRATRTRSMFEVAAAVPVALLALEPYRSWIDSKEYGWWWIAAFIVATGILAGWTKVASRAASQETQKEVAKHLHAITQLARIHSKQYRAGSTPTDEQLQHAVALILTALAQLARALLRIPKGVQVYSNLMVPMPVRISGDPAQHRGCGIVCYSENRPAQPSWTRVAQGDIGAGRTLESGTVEVVEDTRSPRWCGVFESVRTRSFVSLPVLTSTQRTMAVVNIDADSPFIFMEKEAHKVLYPVLAGPLFLLADILNATQEGAVSARSNPRRRKRDA